MLLFVKDNNYDNTSGRGRGIYRARGNRGRGNYHNTTKQPKPMGAGERIRLLLVTIFTRIFSLVAVEVSNWARSS